MLNRKYLSIVIVASAWITLSETPAALARPSQQVPVGPRALAMGGAYSSIADDASALFWNPAGLPWIGHQEITATHANLYDTGIEDNLAGFALSLSSNSAAAIDWYHSGFGDPELDFGESRIDLAYGRRITRFLSAGATVKYLNRNTELDAVTVRQGQGAGFDLGLIATPIPRVRLGVLGQDLFNTKVTYTSGDGTAVAYPMNFRGSVSYAPISSAIVAFDADDRWHLGGEYRPLPVLALRAGLQDDWQGPDGITWSAGAGIKAGLLRFDYALVDHPVLGTTSHFGLTMEFNFNPAQVRIEKVQPRDLYASLEKAYASQPVATVRIRNLDEHPLSTRLRILLPGVMKQATEQEVILRPKATEEIPVSAVLGDGAMEATGNRTVQMQVSATYQSARLPRTERASAKGVLYAAGAIDWSRGVDQAAAFITIRDPVVDALARESTRAAALMPGSANSPRNITFAAAIVDALASLNLAYVPDPNNPYSTISATPHAVDTISYPRETLARRAGDCDDSSVLVSALLENVGIATKLVDVPGHIFILADTGVHERNRLGLGLDDARTIVADEEVWIPIETTAVGKGFAEAWREGSESYAAWAARGRVALVDVDESSERYEPAEPRSPEPKLPDVDVSSLQGRIGTDLRTIGEWQSAYIQERYRAEPDLGTPTPGALNEMARVQLMSDRPEQARALLDRALTLDAKDVPTWNNIGMVQAALGDLQGAASRFEHALTLDESDPGVWLNLGMVRYALGDTAEAEVPLARGIELSGGYDQACSLLALPPASGTEREGSQKMTDAETRMLLQEALRRVPHTAPVSRAPAVPAIRKPRPVRWSSRVAGGRSADQDALPGHLYWKET